MKLPTTKQLAMTALLLIATPGFATEPTETPAPQASPGLLKRLIDMIAPGGTHQGPP